MAKVFNSFREILLRVVTRVSLPSDGIQREYYREVLRSRDGMIHFARYRSAVDSEGKPAMDELAEQSPHFTTEVDCGLKYALQEIKNFISSHWRLEPATHEILKCEPECREGWQAITGEEDQTSDGLFPEQLRFQAEET